MSDVKRFRMPLLDDPLSWPRELRRSGTEIVLGSDYDALRFRVAKLEACCDELREVTKAADDPAVNNTRTLAESVRALRAKVERLTQENARKDDEIMALHQIGSMDDLREIASKCAQRDYCSCAPCEMSYCVTQRFVAELQRKLDAAGPAGEGVCRIASPILPP